MVSLISHFLRNDEVNQIDAGFFFPLENTIFFKAQDINNCKKKKKGSELKVRSPWFCVC